MIMSISITEINAAAAGSFNLGGDLSVNRLGYGAMRITGQPGNWGNPADPEAMRQLLQRVVDLGVNFIDTADAYGPGVSENLVAEALYPYPENLVIATKGGAVKTGPGQVHFDGRSSYLKAACEASLRRLRLERIDLYQYHRVDPQVPFEESVGALAELQREGKIRHIGLSNVTAAQLARAREIVPVASVQNVYSLLRRDFDELVDLCTRDRIAFIPYGPLGTAPFEKEAPLTRSGGLLDEIAQRHGVLPGQVALAWLLKRSLVMLPIPGTTSIQHLEENVAAAAIELSDEEFAALSGLSN
jgi:aryl-alcohol dehydrogenase-like predicted oxidoreductase